MVASLILPCVKFLNFTNLEWAKLLKHQSLVPKGYCATLEYKSPRLGPENFLLVNGALKLSVALCFPLFVPFDMAKTIRLAALRLLVTLQIIEFAHVAGATNLQHSFLNAASGGALVRRQVCDSSTCPSGYTCCQAFPDSCCPAGAACSLGSNNGVQCNINCTSADTACSFGGCCPPGSVCNNLNFNCLPGGNSPSVGSSRSSSTPQDISTAHTNVATLTVAAVTVTVPAVTVTAGGARATSSPTAGNSSGSSSIPIPLFILI
jgi:hypothetical protein